MEADSGSDSRHRRRQSDLRESTGGNRNLDWQNQSTDLLILDPTAKLLHKLLCIPANVIHLNGLKNEHDPDDAEDVTALGDNITPLRPRQKRTRRRPQQNSLAVNLSEADLARALKRIAVESALVKNRDDKRLYLAVGFLHWKGNPEQASYWHSPLLFYPMRLIHEDADEASRGQHLLLNQDAVPDFNYHLQEQFEIVTGITLPAMTDDMTLSTYLSVIENSLKDIPDVTFRFSAQLGIASAPAGLSSSQQADTAELSTVPDSFQPALARALLANKSMQEFQTILKLLVAGQPLVTETEQQEEKLDTPGLKSVNQFARDVSTLGLDNVPFRDLPDISERMEQWVSHIHKSLKLPLIVDTLKLPELTALQLVKLAGIIELIDKAPQIQEDVLHQDLAFQNTPALMKHARHQAQLIEEELANLQQYFHLDKLPAKGQLLQLIEELGGTPANDIEVVDSHYFNARRQFMNFSTDKPTSLSDDHRRLLHKLVKVLRFRELFVNNTEYRLAFGPGYTGLRTDWIRLEHLLNYAQELRTVLGSELMAGNALANWNLFRQQYVESMESLQRASEGVQGLIGIVKPRDSQASAATLVKRATALLQKLKTWQPDERILDTYADRTARELLNLFSGDTDVDSRAETLVKEATDTIRAHLEAAPAELAVSQVNETIQWLQQAVNQQHLALEDINRIVDRYSNDA